MKIMCYFCNDFASFHYCHMQRCINYHGPRVNAQCHTHGEIHIFIVEKTTRGHIFGNFNRSVLIFGNVGIIFFDQTTYSKI